MGFNIDDYYTALTGDNVLLAYKGSITTDFINNVLDTVEAKLQDFDEESKIRKKVYNVLVESLQNLYHHIDELPDNFKDEYDIKFGILVISKENSAYKISTGNFIRSEKIKYLKDK